MTDVRSVTANDNNVVSPHEYSLTTWSMTAETCSQRGLVDALSKLRQADD